MTLFHSIGIDFFCWWSGIAVPSIKYECRQWELCDLNYIISMFLVCMLLVCCVKIENADRREKFRKVYNYLLMALVIALPFLNPSLGFRGTLFYLMVFRFVCGVGLSILNNDDTNRMQSFNQLFGMVGEIITFWLGINLKYDESFIALAWGDAVFSALLNPLCRGDGMLSLIDLERLRHIVFILFAVTMKGAHKDDHGKFWLFVGMHHIIVGLIIPLLCWFLVERDGNDGDDDE